MPPSSFSAGGSSWSALRTTDIPYPSRSKACATDPGGTGLGHQLMTDIGIVSVVKESPPGGEDLKEGEGYETA